MPSSDVNTLSYFEVIPCFDTSRGPLPSASEFEFVEGRAADKNKPLASIFQDLNKRGKILKMQLGFLEELWDKICAFFGFERKWGLVYASVLAEGVEKGGENISLYVNLDAIRKVAWGSLTLKTVSDKEGEDVTATNTSSLSEYLSNALEFNDLLINSLIKSPE